MKLHLILSAFFVSALAQNSTIKDATGDLAASLNGLVELGKCIDQTEYAKCQKDYEKELNCEEEDSECRCEYINGLVSKCMSEEFILTEREGCDDNISQMQERFMESMENMCTIAHKEPKKEEKDNLSAVRSSADSNAPLSLLSAAVAATAVAMAMM